MNKVMLSGYLGADPEVRHTQGGAVVCNLRVYTRSRRKVDGEWVTESEWHSVTAWGKQAEWAGERRKGDPVVVVGELRTREYKDRDGNQRKVTEVMADSFGGLEWPKVSEGGQQARSGPQRPDNTQGGGSGWGGGGAQNSNQGGWGSKPDDPIPF